MTPHPRLNSIGIHGYRPFRDLLARFGPLEVIVGANGSGKSSLFEFLKFLRDSLRQDIPPEIVPGSIGQEIFHAGGPQSFQWTLDMDFSQRYPIRYEGELIGPVGRPQVAGETVATVPPKGGNRFPFMNVSLGKGSVFSQEAGGSKVREISLTRRNQLALTTATDPTMEVLYDLREYILGWRFYNSFNIASEKIRKSVPIEQEPVLHEDAGNLSSVLHYLMQ